MAETQLATRDGRLMTIKQTLNAKRDSIVGMIGDDARAQRFVASAMLIAADDHKILNCDPGSIVRSVLQAATLGLDLASALGEAYLVPRGGVCCLDIGYRGWQRKVHEAGYSMIASAVFEGEVFEYSRAPLSLTHKPSLSEKGRGDFLGSYAAAYVGGVLSHVEWATPEDIERARKMSNSPAWGGWPDRMRRKLAIKRLGKELAAAGSEIIRRVVEVSSLEDKDSGIAGVDEPLDRLLAKPDPATAIPPEGTSNFGRNRPKGRNQTDGDPPNVSRETSAPQGAPESTQSPEPTPAVAPTPNGSKAPPSPKPAGEFNDVGPAQWNDEEPPPPSQADAEAQGQQKFGDGVGF